MRTKSATILACFLLAACGGGGGDAPETAVSAFPAPVAGAPAAQPPTSTLPSPPSPAVGEPTPPTTAPRASEAPVSAPPPTSQPSEPPSASPTPTPSPEPSQPSPPTSARPSPAPAPEPTPVAATRTVTLACQDTWRESTMTVEYDMLAYPWAYLRATPAEAYAGAWLDDSDGSLVSNGAYRIYDDGHSRTVTIEIDQRVPTSWTFVDGVLTRATLLWARATQGSDMVCQLP